MEAQTDYQTQLSNRSWRDHPYLRIIKLVFGWIGAVILALAIQQYAFQSYRVFGQSMEPTLHEGDFLIISKLGPTLAKLKGDQYRPARGDVVVLESPLSDTRLIKRVIGLPGEQIIIKDGEVTIIDDGASRGFDPYARLKMPAEFTAHSINTTVPEGHIFVVGDNREPGGSSDSRNDFGPVDTDLVIGKTVLRLWPLDTISKF